MQGRYQSWGAAAEMDCGYAADGRTANGRDGRDGCGSARNTIAACCALWTASGRWQAAALATTYADGATTAGHRLDLEAVILPLP